MKSTLQKHKTDKAQKENELKKRGESALEKLLKNHEEREAELNRMIDEARVELETKKKLNN